ncbi:hypothetical protein SEVIR_9G375050v4 [Setaria viridis]
MNRRPAPAGIGFASLRAGGLVSPGKRCPPSASAPPDRRQDSRPTNMARIARTHACFVIAQGPGLRRPRARATSRHDGRGGGRVTGAAWAVTATLVDRMALGTRPRPRGQAKPSRSAAAVASTCRHEGEDEHRLFFHRKNRRPSTGCCLRARFATTVLSDCGVLTKLIHSCPCCYKSLRTQIMHRQAK